MKLDYLNIFKVAKKYKDYKNFNKKIEDFDKKKVDEFIKDALEKEKEEAEKKLKLEQQKFQDIENKRVFVKKVRDEVRKELNTTIDNWMNEFGIMSHRCVSDIRLSLREQDKFISKGAKLNLINKDYDEYLYGSYKKHNDRLNLRHNLFSASIKVEDYPLFYILRRSPAVVSKEEKGYEDVFKLFKKLVMLKVRINSEKKKHIIANKNFLVHVLRVLLYVEDIDAEILNEKLAKTFFYTRDVNYNFRVRSNNIKVRSLEWTIPSPPPLHTFYVPVRTIVTNDRFFNYKKGKRLLQNDSYNFTETPSIFQKGFRKLSKSLYLFLNYTGYVLGLKKFDKNPNEWYSGSHYVEEVEEYTHTVEYVSQSVRYPHKNLSKYLPFSAGLHNNTISVDLLITPDKSNTVLFGESKKYIKKPSYLNVNNSYIKPLFIVGDRTSNLCKVKPYLLDDTYSNYLDVVKTVQDELSYNGDGVHVAYYLPSLKTNDIHLIFWSNHVYSDPYMNDYRQNTMGNFFKVENKFDELDLFSLKLDIKRRNNDIISIFPSFIQKKVYDLKNTLLLAYTKYKHLPVLSDTKSVDFIWSISSWYYQFYIPYQVSKKIKTKPFFYRYMLSEYFLKPILGKGWYSMLKADYFVLRNLPTYLKNKFNSFIR